MSLRGAPAARNRKARSDTGRPRGFGFVEMGSQEDADGAIRDLNGHSVDGRDLTVNEAKERTQGGGRGGYGGGGGGY